jgi:hypothetical protein
MGMNLGGGYAAGAGADALKDLLKERWLQGQARIRNDQDQQHINLIASGQDLEQGRYNTSRDDAKEAVRIKGAAAATAKAERDTQIAGLLADPNTSPQMKLALQYQNVTGDNAPSGIFDKPEKPSTQPVMRVNPRTGKMESLGDAPTGAHFVNEPAPPTPPQNKFNLIPGTDANGKPMMYRVNQQTGESSAVNLGEGVTAGRVTDAQTTLGLYAKRVEQAEPTLTGLTKAITSMNPLMFEAQMRADNPNLQSKEIQQYRQAERNFINSVLRRESGAVISPAEYAEARKQYIPVSGDADETIQLKAQNRATVGVSFQRGAGAAYQGPKSQGGGTAGSSADPLGLRTK